MLIFSVFCALLCLFSTFKISWCRFLSPWSLPLMGVLWVSLISILGVNWVNEGRPPFKTFYETYILLAFSLTSAGLFAHYISEKPLYSKAASLLVIIVLCWALANPDLESIVLPPALQSPWFVPHVMVYFMGYSFTLISGMLAIIGLFNKQRNYHVWIDHTMRAAFMLLMIGICFGSLWADEAWGTYWGWDPKESWALVSLLSVAAYCHLPKKTRHSRAGLVWTAACVSFVVFTYMGMHLLPTADMSVHLYSSTKLN